MKVELLVIAFLAAVSSAGIVTKESTPTYGPDEFECPKGCCPEAYFTPGWIDKLCSARHTCSDQIF